MYRFLDEWKSVKETFIRPKFKIFIGKWRNYHGLPIWRRGNMISFGKYGEYDSEWNYCRLVKCNWNSLGKKNHPILSKIFKPLYVLPIWLSFYYFNRDIVYKTKWTEWDFRYEFPADICIVIFGFAIAITAYIKIDGIENFTVNDDYWESLLTYKYFKGDLEEVNKQLEAWNSDKGKYFRFNPLFLKKEEERNKLIKIQNDSN